MLDVVVSRSQDPGRDHSVACWLLLLLGGNLRAKQKLLELGETLGLRCYP